MRRYFDRASFWMVLGTVLLTGTAQALNSGFSYYIWLYQSGAFGNDFASGLSDATAQWNYTIWQWLLPSLCVAWALFVVYRKKDILYYTLPLVLIVLLGNGVEEGIVWIFQQYFHGQRTGLFYTSQSCFLPQGMTVWGWLLGALLCLWARRAKPKEAGRRWRDLAPFAAVCIGYWAICSALLIWLPRAERSSPAPLFAEWFLQLGLPVLHVLLLCFLAWYKRVDPLWVGAAFLLSAALPLLLFRGAEAELLRTSLENAMPPLLTGLAMLAWMCRRPVAAWWGAGLLALLLLFWPVSLWGMEKISARAANWIIFWLRPWGPFVAVALYFVVVYGSPWRKTGNREKRQGETALSPIPRKNFEKDIDK